MVSHLYDTAPWYDNECRSVKKTTRKLERCYRSHRTAENKSAWRQQFDFQRNFYQNKVNSFWTTTVNIGTIHAVYGRLLTTYCNHQNKIYQRSSQLMILPYFSKIKWPRFVRRLQQPSGQSFPPGRHPRCRHFHQLQSKRLLNC